MKNITIFLSLLLFVLTPTITTKNTVIAGSSSVHYQASAHHLLAELSDAELCADCSETAQ